MEFENATTRVPVVAKPPPPPYKLYQLWLVVLTLFARLNPNKAPVLQIDTSLLLDEACSTPQLSVSAVKEALNEAGFVFVLVLEIQSSCNLWQNCYVRANHIHLLTGISTGASLLLMFLLLFVQLLSTTVLSVPKLYKKLGSVLPGFGLSSCALVEASVFGDLNDSTTILQLLCFTCSTVLVALFRHDKQQRQHALQVPVETSRVQEKARTLCTVCSAGVVCPPIACISLYSALCNIYWTRRPVLVEYTRSRHQLALAACALSLLLSAHDRNGPKKMTNFLEWIVTRVSTLFRRRIHRKPKKGLKHL
jgi:hypothetical protein